MKKVINITIGGLVFFVEEDAFEKLSTYLDSIKKHFAKDKDKEEILEDLEASVAEKFLARRKRKDAAVSVADVKKVMKEMGTLKDFESVSAEEFEEEGAGKKVKSAVKNEEGDRKLYRDGEDIIIAGVASGLAAYLGIETVLMRLIFFVTVFFGGAGVLIYIVLWVIMPVAKTTTQKLEMRGDRITLKEIEKSVKKGVEKLKKKDLKNVRGGLDKFFRVFGKLVMAFLTFLRVLVGFAVFVLGLVGIVVFGFSLAWLVSGSVIPGTDIVLMELFAFEGISYWLFYVSVYFVVFMPVLMLFILGVSLLTKKKTINLINFVGIVFLWFLAIGFIASISFNNWGLIEEGVGKIMVNVEGEALLLDN